MKATRSIQSFISLVFVLFLASPASHRAFGVELAPADVKMAEGSRLFQQGALERAVIKWTDALTLYEQAQRAMQQFNTLMWLTKAYQASD